MYIPSPVTTTARQVTAALALAAGTLHLVGLAQEPAGARQMFYNPATGTIRTASPPSPTPPTPPSPPPIPPRGGTPTKPPAPVRFVGVRYWLDLEGVGPVADTRTFHTGERIRLNIQSNCDGYFAIWTVSRDRTPKLLIPANAETVALSLKQSTPFVSAPIRFSEPANDERLILFFARQKASLPSLETLQGKGALAAFLGQGSRDLAIEVEEAAPGEVGTYVVNRVGGPVSRDIVLRHNAVPGLPD